MISNEVIKPRGLFLVLLGLEIDLLCFCLENLVPFGLKSSPAEELPLLNTNLRSEHGRIPSNPQLNIDFP